MNLSSKYVKSS